MSSSRVPWCSSYRVASVNPEHGGRFELHLASGSLEDVEYQGTLSTPDANWDLHASVHTREGRVEVRAAETAPKWLVDAVERLLRTLWRARQLEASSWPRRLTRWRKGPADEHTPG